MTLRNAAVSLVGAAVLIGAGTASSGSKSVTLRPTSTLRTAKIALLAADGARAAVAPAKRRPCASIVVWDPSKNRTSGFHLRTNGCAGDGVRALALSDDQVAWIEHGGGNDLELTLFAARLRGGRATQLDFRVNGDRAGGDPSGGWIGNLVGSGSVLAYNGWRLVCDRADPFSCGRHDPQLRLIDQRLVRIVSGHATTIASGPDTYSLAAAGGGLVAVEHADSVATFTAGGARAAVVPDSPPNPSECRPERLSPRSRARLFTRSVRAAHRRSGQVDRARKRLRARVDRRDAEIRAAPDSADVRARAARRRRASAARAAAGRATRPRRRSADRGRPLLRVQRSQRVGAGAGRVRTDALARSRVLTRPRLPRPR
jgi:hypothetical protein